MGVVTALLVGAVALGACSSGSSPQQTPLGSTTPSTPTSSSMSSSTPAPSSSKTAPLSPFEDDPAVEALRTWTDQAAKTVNTGRYDSAALKALMTATLAKTMKNVLGREVGYRYPGPVPFLPLSVSAVSSTRHHVKACFVDSGFSLNPKTGKPAQAFRVGPIDAEAQLANGKWIVSVIDTGRFSCAGAKVPMPKW
jgi:hypothetical protein